MKPRLRTVTRGASDRCPAAARDLGLRRAGAVSLCRGHTVPEWRAPYQPPVV